MLQHVKTKSNNIIISEKEGMAFKGTKQYLWNLPNIINFIDTERIITRKMESIFDLSMYKSFII